MKINIAAILLMITSISLSSGLKAQEKGSVYFLRSTNEIGSMIAYKVYIDDQLVCNLKNKRYPMHGVPVGDHTVTIRNTGLSRHTKARPLKIKVLADKNNYLVVVNASQPYLQETVESSALELLKRVAETRQCLPAKATR